MSPTNAPGADDWNFETFKVLMDERFAAQKDALKLQAGEYERRLEDLNHAHELAREKERDYVSMEKYEDFLKRYDADRQAIAKALTLAEGTNKGMARFGGLIVGGVGFLVGVGSLILVVGDVLTP